MFNQVVATFGNTADVLTRRGKSSRGSIGFGNRVTIFKFGNGGLYEFTLKNIDG